MFVIWKMLKHLSKQTRAYSSQSRPFIEKFIGGDVILEPSDSVYRNTVIWLHGKGECGKTYTPIFNCKNSVVPLDTKIILPTAPERVTRNEILNCWYDADIFASRERAIRFEHLYWARDYIMEIVDKEAQIFRGNYERIALGGFSQGSALALWLFLQCRKDLGGFCGFSGYLYNFADIEEGAKQNIPIFLYHGNRDNTISSNFALSTYQKLEGFKFNVKIVIEKGLGHWISPRGLSYMKYFFYNLFKEEDCTE